MCVPEIASHTTNAYLAFRAAQLALRKYGAERGQPVRLLSCPGLCTGVGAPTGFADIHRIHEAMRTE